jgi:hypothetical protein
MINEKVDQELFESAVRYHIGNLSRGLRSEYVKDGIMYFRGEDHLDTAVPVGEENSQHWNRGLLFFFNGSDVVSNMKKVGMIPSDTPQNYERMWDICSFLEGTSSLKKKDGAIIYDRNAKAYTKAKVNENAPAVRKIEGGLESILPVNFVAEDCSKSIIDSEGTNVGCRTQAAFKATRGFDGADGNYHHLYSILIKQTAYNPLGLGTVSYITDDSLDMFSFRHMPGKDMQYIALLYEIAGVHKSYQLSNKRFRQTGEDIVHVNREGHLAYDNGEPVFKKEQRIIVPVGMLLQSKIREKEPEMV